MYLSEIKRMLLKVNDVKTMHFIYVIIKDALEDLDGWKTEDMFCNLNHHSNWIGGIRLSGNKQKILEMVKRIDNEKILRYICIIIEDILNELPQENGGDNCAMEKKK